MKFTHAGNVLRSWFQSKKRTLITLGFFLLCWIVSFGVRTYHYNMAVYKLNGIIGDVPAEKLEAPPSFFRRFLPYRHQNFMPFTIESAMMYAYAQDVANGKGVPAHDKTLCGMEDIPPYAQMNMGLEWFLGWSWRIWNKVSPCPDASKRALLFEDNPAMQHFMSTEIRLWASLTSALVFLWLVFLHCPKWLAVTGGLLHAVALAAVARATGQDLVRGEFCIPLIMMAFVTFQSIAYHPKVWKYVFLFAVTFLAFVTWDLCQMIFSAWIAVELLRYLFGFRMPMHRLYAWCAIALAVLLNALFVPFNVTYALIRSPLVCVLLPVVLFAFLLTRYLRDRIRSWKARPRILVRLAAGLVLPIALYAAWSVTVNTPEYSSNYIHFTRTMQAKLKFRNVKPPDPSQLNFDARIMWTPSMHSATWEIACQFFPSLQFGRNYKFAPLRFFFGYLPVTLAYFFALLAAAHFLLIPRRKVMERSALTLMPVLFALGFFIGFIYIVRYHEFLIIFLSLSLPLLIRDLTKAFPYAPEKVQPEEACTIVYRKKWFSKLIRIGLPSLLILCLILETYTSLRARRLYTGDVAMRETAALILWFRKYGGEAVHEKGVAANITIGPMLRAYAGTGVVMNPQFGMKRIRDATEDYLMTLYHQPEGKLAEYCQKHKARYVVYHRGALSGGPYSNRYIANAVKLKQECAAVQMLFAPKKLSWFYPVEPPDHLQGLSKVYTVFWSVWPDERERASKLLLQAKEAEQRQDVEQAKELIRESVSLDPLAQDGREFFMKLYGDYPDLDLNGLVMPTPGKVSSAAQMEISEKNKRIKVILNSGYTAYHQWKKFEKRRIALEKIPEQYLPGEKLEKNRKAVMEMKSMERIFRQQAQEHAQKAIELDPNLKPARFFYLQCFGHGPEEKAKDKTSEWKE